MATDLDSGPRGEYGKQKEKLRLEDVYKPSREVQEEIFDVYEKFIRWRSLREQPYKQFDMQPMSIYLQRAREKFWGFLPISHDDDAPQFFFPETRNQIIGILSKIANMKMKAMFQGVKGFDIVKSTVLKDLFEHWKRATNEKIKSFWNYLYTVVNGTCVVFVAYRDRERTVRSITEYDPHTGESKWEERDIDDSEIVEELVNLEDFYVPKIWEPDLQDQEEVIWRTLIKFSDFKNAFAGYELVDTVIPGMQFADTSIFSQFLSYDVRGGDFVEVIRYFNAPKDKYMIICNGVLMNPVKLAGAKDQVVSPLPWNHKQLPFAKTVFEPIDPTFFYGMPLAMKVKYPQNALNMMWSLLLEREMKSVSAPILTNDPAMELGLEFRAGKIYQVQTDPEKGYRELTIAPASSSFWNSLESLDAILARTGSGGTTPQQIGRQPNSATAKAQQAQQEAETAGFYTLFYQDLLEQVAWLVMENMIQFYTADKTKETLGKKQFNKILSLVNVELVGGGTGNREIRITDHPSSSKDLNKESYDRSLFHKERVEIIEVTPEAVRALKFDIKIEFDQEESPQQEKAMYMDFVLTIMKLFGQQDPNNPQSALIDPKKVLFRLLDKFGENASDFIPDTLIKAYQDERFGFHDDNAAKLSPGALKAVNDVNQAMRGMQNGAGGPAAQMPAGNPLSKGQPAKKGPARKAARPVGAIT
jgi:hypothetical protein